MENIFLIIHVLSAIALIGFILIQQGKGAETGASFGSGASQTLFGSQGSGSFLTRITAILATLFFASSLILTLLSHHNTKTKSIDEIMSKTQGQTQSQTQTENQKPAQQPEIIQEKNEEMNKEVKLNMENKDNDIPSIVEPKTGTEQ